MDRYRSRRYRDYRHPDFQGADIVLALVLRVHPHSIGYRSKNRALGIRVEKIVNFGIGCLQHGFMRNCSMTARTTPRTTTLATIIRHATTMTTRRIIDVQ